jgi:diacylglycerol kinase (ATP)
MNKIKIIYNPNAGRGDGQDRVERLAIELLNRNFTVSVFRTITAEDALNEAFHCAISGEWDLLIAAGGDGTLNEVVNGIMKSGKRIKLSVFPLGTMNDFGRFLNIPKKPSVLAERISIGNMTTIDVGKIADRYFINVASMGIFTDVAHTTPTEAKNILGPVAYYIEGLKQFTATTLPKALIEINSNEFDYNGEFILFLISNSSSIGGFHKMAPLASVNDGRFDCVLIKTAPFHRLFELFLKVLNGQHIDSPYVEYFQSDHIAFKTSGDVDVDGEYHGTGNQDVMILSHALEMII